MPSPLSGQDSPPGAPFHGTTDSGGPAGARGERETTTPARPRAPEGRPGALQGHHRGPRRNSDRTPNVGEARAARRRDAPSPPRGGALARRSRERRAEGVRCVRETTGVTPRSGRVPHPFPSPSTHRRRTVGGERGEGPAGRARRAVPFDKECPSLVWRGLGPARESATSPHRSSGKKHREEGQRGEDNRSERACASAPQRKPFPSLSQAEREARSAGDGARDSQQPARAGPRRTAFARAAAGGEKSGFWSRPRSSRGQPPRRPITQGQRVHTNLVVQNANFRQNMDCAR